MPQELDLHSTLTYRLIHDEVNDKYCIQKKRFFFGYRTFYRYKNYESARTALGQLRENEKIRRTRNKHVILND